jgi:hypothetical protein
MEWFISEIRCEEIKLAEDRVQAACLARGNGH